MKHLNQISFLVMLIILLSSTCPGNASESDKKFCSVSATSECLDIKTWKERTEEVSAYIIANDLDAKSLSSINLEFRAGLFEFLATKPINRKLGSNDLAILDISFPSRHFGISYVMNGDTDNYDSIVLNFMFLRCGWNVNGKPGGISYFGRWNDSTNKPRRFFVVSDLYWGIGSENSFFNKTCLALKYNGGFSAGLRYKHDSKFSAEWRYNFDSSYLDEIRRNHSSGFRNTVSLQWQF